MSKNRVRTAVGVALVALGEHRDARRLRGTGERCGGIAGRLLPVHDCADSDTAWSTR